MCSSRSTHCQHGNTPITALGKHCHRDGVGAAGFAVGFEPSRFRAQIRTAARTLCGPACGTPLAWMPSRGQGQPPVVVCLFRAMRCGGYAPVCGVVPTADAAVVGLVAIWDVRWWPEPPCLGGEASDGVGAAGRPAPRAHDMPVPPSYSGPRVWCLDGGQRILINLPCCPGAFCFSVFDVSAGEWCATVWCWPVLLYLCVVVPDEHETPLA